MVPGELKIIESSKATVDPLKWPESDLSGVSADILRLDKIHPVVSGNKWFKLKEHLQTAAARGARHLTTFGGAWSNHIVATAWAAREAGLPVTGIIRGDEPPSWSSTLQTASSYGMRLQFISRAEYARQTRPFSGDPAPAGEHTSDPLPPADLAAAYPGSYIIPEGGGGPAGVKGSKEILSLVERSRYSHICCAIGTGTTYLGLAEASLPEQWIIGIPVLKGLHGFLADIRDRLSDPKKLDHCRISPDYHFGGYARKPDELIGFINHFYRRTGIPTDFVYTGKLFYAVLDMIGKGLFPSGSRLLIVHTGGLQGNSSLEPGILDF
jgi:1-aminocyclopropane-1-carboxylate deaminase